MTRTTRTLITFALLAALVLVAPGTTFAGPEAQTPSSLSYPIVDTGQTSCYDDKAEIAPSAPGEAFFGQDAQHSGNTPQYRDNRDGTVSDLVTGLMWAQSPDLNGDGRIDAADKLSFDDALARAAELRLAGYTDWRLPTIKELYSLMDFSGTDVDPRSAGTDAQPFIDTATFAFAYGDMDAGERLIDAQFASSTRYVSTTMDGNRTMFGLNLADGRIKGYPADRKNFYVLYVRGNPEYGENEFRDNGDGTVSDLATGLMWSRSDSGTGMDWQEALAWVEQKNTESYLGYSDWRLPDAKELQSLVDYSRAPDISASAAIDPVFDTTVVLNEAAEGDFPCFWSSTTHVCEGFHGGESAVYLAFGRALGKMWGRWIDVHGAGAQRSDPKTGDPSRFANGRGPQGDAIRIDNFVRLVRSET